MSTADLKNYLNDGGCILFVVYIQKFDYSTTIYYAELTPIKLRNLLEKGKKQNTKTVHLKIFPSESNDKTTIFLNCLQNCQKQASFIEGKLPDLEELKSQQNHCLSVPLLVYPPQYTSTCLLPLLFRICYFR